MFRTEPSSAPQHNEILRHSLATFVERRFEQNDFAIWTMVRAKQVF